MRLRGDRRRRCAASIRAATVRVIANGCDFDDFAGLEYTPAPRFRITHTGSFFGKRDPRPFLQAFHDADLDAVARFVGDFRSSDREWAGSLGLGDRLELVDYLPRAESLRLQRDSEALLLLVPDAGGRGKGVLSGQGLRVPRRGPSRSSRSSLPDGAAAELVRETGAGVVVAPGRRRGDPGRARRAPRRASRTAGSRPSSSPERDEERLSRRARVEEMAALVARDRMTTPRAARSRGRSVRDRVLVQPVLDGLFLLTILTVTFHKLQWSLAGSLTLSDILTSVFLVALRVGPRRAERRTPSAHRGGRASRSSSRSRSLYLAGFYSLDTAQALAQWAKGMVKFVLHFGFLVTGIALLAPRGAPLLLVRPRSVPRRDRRWTPSTASSSSSSPRRGVNLDEILIQPITSRQTGINVFGAVGGTQEVFRPNALTGDPNHLGIELVIPLLVLTPLYLRLEAGHRLKTPLAIALAFLLVVELATLSRSALLGLGVRRARCSCCRTAGIFGGRRSSCRSAPSGVLVATVIVVRLDFFLTVLRARTNTSRGAASPHFAVYSFIPGHPLDAPVPRPRA